MASKDGKKTGGRKKGTPNKFTQDLHELAQEMGVNPFEVLLNFAKGDYKALRLPETTAFGSPTIPPELRQKAAKDACEYLFPKRKAIEHTGANGADLFAQMLREIDGSKKS